MGLEIALLYESELTNDPDTMTRLISLGPGIAIRWVTMANFSSVKGSIPTGRT